MNERDILNQIAGQTAPGTSSSDAESVERFRGGREKFRDRLLERFVAGLEGRIRLFGEEPLTLPLIQPLMTSRFSEKTSLQPWTRR